ncbi:hypothetical protein [Argonema galeatum]|nr:hypothetical protein [Argonema galeatum]MCL1468245.1 hypothetical protein [Argonema galeatum A003/A1]
MRYASGTLRERISLWDMGVGERRSRSIVGAGLADISMVKQITYQQNLP